MSSDGQGMDIRTLRPQRSDALICSGSMASLTRVSRAAMTQGTIGGPRLRWQGGVDVSRLPACFSTSGETKAPGW